MPHALTTDTHRPASPSRTRTASGAGAVVFGVEAGADLGHFAIPASREQVGLDLRDEFLEVVEETLRVERRDGGGHVERASGRPAR